MSFRMKYSFRKSFSSRRRRRRREDDDDLRNANPICSNSNSNLVNPVKKKTRRSSPTFDETKSKVFEPRYDVHSSDDEEEEEEKNQPFSSSSKLRSFHRLTHQIRQSFRKTRRQQTPRSKLDDDQNPISILPPTISIGLTSPLSKEDNHHQENTPRTRFSFFRRKSSNNENNKNPTSSTLTERFHSLRRSFHIGTRQRQLLKNE